MTAFNKNFNELLRQNAYSQRRIAAVLGVSQQTISRWVRGENEPDFDMLTQICRTLDTTPNDILGWESPKRGKKRRNE